MEFYLCPFSLDPSLQFRIVLFSGVSIPSLPPSLPPNLTLPSTPRTSGQESGVGGNFRIPEISGNFSSNYGLLNIEHTGSLGGE